MGNTAVIPAGTGEHPVIVDIPANGEAKIKFTVAAGQPLSFFKVNYDKSPGLGASLQSPQRTLEANLSTDGADDGIFATANGRSTGSNQGHLQHSDTGTSNSLNLSPTDYTYILSDPTGAAHTGVYVTYHRG
jgi:hypothetical protein